MKPLHLVVFASLAANLVLAAMVFQKHNAPPASSSAVVAHPTAAGASASELAGRGATAEALASAAKSGDPTGVRDQLRALGLPEDVIRSVVRALVGKRYLDIQKSITAAHAGNGYWRTSPGGMFNYSAMTKEERLKLRDASREATKQLEELMGPDPMDPSVSRFSFLPPEKAAKARDLNRDYEDLRMQIMAETEGFRLPADDEKLAFLEKEQRKDLAALLSPEELEAYDMRNSNTAARLRSQLRDVDLSEAEYKALYEAQKAFDDKFSNRAAGGSDAASNRDLAQARAQAQQQLNETIKATLGDDRFNAYLRSQNGEYRALEAAAKRFSLPQTTVDQVFATRDQTVAAAQRIANDTNLNPDQRRQALATLADQTRSQVRTSLGADVADTYLKTNMRWLDALQRGQPIAVTPEGNVYPRPGSQANPPAAAAVPGSSIPPSVLPPKG